MNDIRGTSIAMQMPNLRKFLLEEMGWEIDSWLNFDELTAHKGNTKVCVKYNDDMRYFRLTLTSNDFVIEGKTSIDNSACNLIHLFDSCLDRMQNDLIVPALNQLKALTIEISDEGSKSGSKIQFMEGK